MPKIVGTLPKVPHLTLSGPDQTPYLTSVTKIGPEKAVFCGFSTLTIDLWPWFAKHWRGVINVNPHTKNDSCRSVGPSPAAGKLPNRKCDLSKVIIWISKWVGQGILSCYGTRWFKWVPRVLILTWCAHIPYMLALMLLHGNYKNIPILPILEFLLLQTKVDDPFCANAEV